MHTPGGEKVYVYADTDTVHVNVAIDRVGSNGKYPVCIGDLGDLDSIGFLKGIVKLLFTMNCDSPYNHVLRGIVADTILTDSNKLPVQTEAEVFSTSKR